MKQRKCPICTKTLPLTKEYFYKDKSNVEGFGGRCKKCGIKSATKWSKNNPERKYQQNKKQWNSEPPGVYMLKCLINGRCYIGKSVAPKNRTYHHFGKHKMNGKYTNPLFQADLEKYGRSAMIWGIIEYCDEKDLLNREEYWIKKLNPYYNSKHK